MRLRPILRPILSSPLHGIFGPALAPDGAILHYDADIDAFSELTGGPHAFNHAVLSPQYQRNADGSYTDVGAKPAVDVFGGEKWLRSCGAVENLLPSGAEDLSSWDKIQANVASAGLPTPYGGEAYRISATSAVEIHQVYKISSGSAPGTYTVSGLVKKDTTRYVVVALSASNEAPSIFAVIDFDLKEINLIDGTGQIALEELRDGWFLYTITGAVIEGDGVATSFIYVLINNSGDGNYAGDGESVLVGEIQLTQTPYPVPYTPPGTTMPASNATTTNGVWFALPDGSPLWQALTGQPLTLATRVRMGVGSGDVSDYTMMQILTCYNSTASTLYCQGIDGDTGADRIVGSFCGGSGYNTLTSAWNRNAIVLRFLQVNSDVTQFRVGFMIEGVHMTIQWSRWVNYDGSYDPSTIYRLMLGYNNAYPMWFNKITAWKEEVDDSRILEAWT